MSRRVREDVLILIGALAIAVSIWMVLGRYLR